MIIPPDSVSCLYFERLEDGSLEELLGTDSPFEVCSEANGNIFGAQSSSRTALADWDGDGEIDLILVDDKKVALWSNRPMDAFVEVLGSDNPFAQLPRLERSTDVTVVDVDGDSKMDIVIPPSTFQWRYDGDVAYKYFKNEKSGLVEQQNAANPFQHVTYNWSVPDVVSDVTKTAKNLLVDLDGDGDLDIVYGNLHYTRNDGARFTHVHPTDPAHPFLGIEDNEQSCWTFVDWDRDGYMDLVHAYKKIRRPFFAQLKFMLWVQREIKRMKENGASRELMRAFAQKHLAPKIRFYRNTGVNATFEELNGTANPFDGIQSLELDPMCPSLVDLDNDGALELVMGTQEGTLENSFSSFWVFCVVCFGNSSCLPFCYSMAPC